MTQLSCLSTKALRISKAPHFYSLTLPFIFLGTVRNFISFAFGEERKRQAIWTLLSDLFYRGKKSRLRAVKGFCQDCTARK